MLRIIRRGSQFGRLVSLFGAACALAVTAIVGLLPGSAFAETFPGAAGCGTLPSDGNVYLDCVVPPTTGTFQTYTDGEGIDISMGPFASFDNTQIKAIECEYLGANPSNDTLCNAQTAPLDFPYSVSSNGSFDYAADNAGDAAPVYAQPDSTFPGSAITCDATHACVWWVGFDYVGGFTSGPHAFSNPFFVTGSTVATTTTTSATTTTVAGGSTTTTSSTSTTVQPTSTTTSTTPGSTTSTTTGSSGGGTTGSSGGGDTGSTGPSSAGAGGATDVSSGSLAFTGSPSLMWLMILGGLLLAVGTVGRRLTASAHP